MDLYWFTLKRDKTLLQSWSRSKCANGNQAIAAFWLVDDPTTDNLDLCWFTLQKSGKILYNHARDRNCANGNLAIAAFWLVDDPTTDVEI